MTAATFPLSRLHLLMVGPAISVHGEPVEPSSFDKLRMNGKSLKLDFKSPTDFSFRTLLHAHKDTYPF